MQITNPYNIYTNFRSDEITISPEDITALTLAILVLVLSIIAIVYLFVNTAPARSSNYSSAPITAQTTYNTAIRRCKATPGVKNKNVLRFRESNGSLDYSIRIDTAYPTWGGQRMDTYPNRVHTESNKMMSSFFYGVTVGYSTYFVCWLPYIQFNLLGDEWKKLEIIWLNLNALFCGAMTVYVWYYIERIMAVALDTSVLIFLRHVLLDKIKCDDTVSNIMKYDCKKISEWVGNTNDDATDTVIIIVGMLGQIIVVEVSVIFFNIVICSFALWSKYDVDTSRSNNIIDALNAGALLAWLVVVGLTVSMAMNARSCYIKLQARIRESIKHGENIGRETEELSVDELKARNSIYKHRETLNATLPDVYETPEHEKVTSDSGIQINTS